MADDQDDIFSLCSYENSTRIPSGGPASCVFFKTRIGVMLDFIPIQFTKDNIPEKEDDFYLVKDVKPENRFLLADGDSKALIIASLVVLNSNDEPIFDNGVARRFYNEEGIAGDITIELEDGKFGTLSYKNQKDTNAILIPIEDLNDGKTGEGQKDANAIIFKTTTKIGQTGINAFMLLASLEDCFESRSLSLTSSWKAKIKHDFWIKPNEKIGSREFGKKQKKGFDVLKLQWHLKNFGFFTYKPRNVGDLGNRCEWTEIVPMIPDNDLGDKTVRCLEDFQKISKGSFRNQNQPNVPITFDTDISQIVNDQVAGEIVVWHKKDYKVDCYHGRVWINYDDAQGTITQNAQILYGAIIVDNNPNGYLEVRVPMGETICHFGNRAFSIASSIHSAIRLFLNRDMHFRLHDADPHNYLSNLHLHRILRNNVPTMLGAIRREQTTDFSRHRDGNNRDVMVMYGYRDWAQQTLLNQQNPGGAAPAGRSWHNFGLAVDIIFYDSRGLPTYCHTYIQNSNDCLVPWIWTPIQQGAISNNWTWGGGFQNDDRPHIQVPNFEPTDQVRKTYYCAGDPVCLLSSLQAAINTYNQTQAANNNDVMPNLQAVWTSLGIPI